MISNDVIVDETKEWDWNIGMERQTNETVEVELEGEEIQDEVQIDNEQYVNDELGLYL